MLCTCSALDGGHDSRRGISMERFCGRSINNLVLVTVSLYPSHSTPFNVTITGMTQQPYSNSAEKCTMTLCGHSWAICTNMHNPTIHVHCPQKMCFVYNMYTWLSFQDNWFSITYTQSATTRYFSCQVYFWYKFCKDLKLNLWRQNPRERDEWIASLRKTLQPAEDRRLELTANI